MEERTCSSDSFGLPDGELHRGTRIGKYEVLTRLSLGGMAELFLGFTAGPGGFRKYVALKRVLPEVRADEEFVKMFLDEARITAAFNHPNIAQVYDLGEQDDGLYLAMEFVSGQNLNQVTRACARKRAVLPIAFSTAVARDVCSALHYAHTFSDPVGRFSPVVHRDVTPKNVMVTFDGMVKLLDFGVAKAKGRLGGTLAGMVRGTTGYMSPEQVHGDEIDGRTDVFAVGVLLHELVTGQRLFAAASEAEEMRLVLEAPIPKPTLVSPMVPEALCEVVMRALSRERADRFESAKELGQAIERGAGKLLFDRDQRAAFMHEVFETKMLAARAMLEAAEQRTSGSAAAFKKALQTVREDDGDSSAARAAAAGRARFVEQPGAAAAPRRQPRRTTTGALPVARQRFRAVALFCFTAAAAFFAYKLLSTSGLSSEGEAMTEPERYPADVPRPVPAAQRAPLTPAGPLDAPGATKKPEPNEPVKGGRPAASRAGALTLVTTPECTVMFGGKALGKTPLFGAPLPAGTHLLTLRAEDGTQRVLSAPIAAGKTTVYRLKLADLPPR